MTRLLLILLVALCLPSFVWASSFSGGGGGGSGLSTSDAIVAIGNPADAPQSRSIIMRDGLVATDAGANSTYTLDWKPDPNVVWVNEEFCGGVNSSKSVGAFGWIERDIVGTGTYAQAASSLPNLCVWTVTSGGTSGNASAYALNDTGDNGFTTFGDHTGTLPWEANLIFKIGQTATTSQWIGLGNNLALSVTPADFIGVRWDTSLDTTNFFFVCRAAGVETGNHIDTTIAADTNWHRIRIYSTVANQINFELYSASGVLQKQSLNACSTSANIPTASLTLLFQSGTRTSSTSIMSVDYASYKRRVAR